MIGNGQNIWNAFPFFFFFCNGVGYLRIISSHSIFDFKSSFLESRIFYTLEESMCIFYLTRIESMVHIKYRNISRFLTILAVLEPDVIGVNINSYVFGRVAFWDWKKFVRTCLILQWLDRSCSVQQIAFLGWCTY